MSESVYKYIILPGLRDILSSGNIATACFAHKEEARGKHPLYLPRAKLVFSNLTRLIDVEYTRNCTNRGILRGNLYHIEITLHCLRLQQRMAI